jgi:hypothetical protein
VRSDVHGRSDVAVRSDVDGRHPRNHPNAAGQPVSSCQHFIVDRPRIVTYNLASVDGRLTLAAGVSLLTGDSRWTAVTSGVGDFLPDAVVGVPGRRWSTALALRAGPHRRPV